MTQTKGEEREKTGNTGPIQTASWTVRVSSQVRDAVAAAAKEMDTSVDGVLRAMVQAYEVDRARKGVRGADVDTVDRCLDTIRETVLHSARLYADVSDRLEAADVEKETAIAETDAKWKGQLESTQEKLTAALNRMQEERDKARNDVEQWTSACNVEHSQRIEAERQLDVARETIEAQKARDASEVKRADALQVELDRLRVENDRLHTELEQAQVRASEVPTLTAQIQARDELIAILREQFLRERGKTDTGQDRSSAADDDG